MLCVVVAMLAVAVGTEAARSLNLRSRASSVAADALACLQVSLKLQHARPSQEPSAPENRTPASTPTPLRRLNLLFKGYNIYYGNPFSTTETDEGFMKYAGKPIFKTKYDQKQVTIDGHNLVPDGLQLRSAQSPCTEVSVMSAPGRTERLDAMSTLVAEEGGCDAALTK